MPNYMAKNLLDLFGFPYISAPGEAEAECALLQREGIVDAVLSDDVDTLMFGSTLTLRNWSSEGTRGPKNPTHVNAYHSAATQSSSGLDRAGMILVALMSGGDYAPGGIPSCGPKTACEAARAGFGDDLCKISRKDRTSLNQWRERLEYELHTNKSGFFRTKHHTLSIPENFPDRTVLGYYTHPVVSSAEKVADLRKSITWDDGVHIPELRAFTVGAFEWLGLPGAKKFIRGIAPGLLVEKLWRRSTSDEIDNDDLRLKAEQELRLIKSLHGTRSHSITDGVPEVRVSFLPSEVVGLDLSQEDTEVYLDMNLDNDSGSDLPDNAENEGNYPSSPSKRRGLSQFDPNKEQKMWIMETIAKLGVPLTVETWEEDMRDPKKFASRKAPEVKAAGKGSKHTAQTARLESYLKASKSVTAIPKDRRGPPSKAPVERSDLGKVHAQSRPTLEELADAADPAMDKWDKTSRKLTGSKPVMGRNYGSSKAATNPSKATAPKSRLNAPTVSLLSSEINPWTLSQTTSDVPDADTISHKHSSTTIRKGTTGHGSNKKRNQLCRATEKAEIVSLLSSPTQVPLAAITLNTQNVKRSALDLTISKATSIQECKDYSSPRTISIMDNRELVITSKASNRPDFLGAGDSYDETPLLSSQLLPPLSDSIVPRGLSNIYGEERLSFRGNTNILRQRRTEKSSKKAIILRESLEGAWKMVDGLDDVVKKPKVAFRGIEIVDLIED